MQCGPMQMASVDAELRCLGQAKLWTFSCHDTAATTCCTLHTVSHHPVSSVLLTWLLQAAMGGAQGMPGEEDLEMLVAQMQDGMARREAGEGPPAMLQLLH